jgi:hypothetical protein
MRVNAHLPYGYGGHTDFVNMNFEHCLWRLIGKKNKAAIYDNVLTSGIFKMVLVTPNKRIWLYSGLTWFFHNGKMDYLLIRFINKRYKTFFKEENFRATKDMIQFILDREDI